MNQNDSQPFNYWDTPLLKKLKDDYNIEVTEGSNPLLNIALDNLNDYLANQKDSESILRVNLFKNCLVSVKEALSSKPTITKLDELAKKVCQFKADCLRLDENAHFENEAHFLASLYGFTIMIDNTLAYLANYNKQPGKQIEEEPIWVRKSIYDCFCFLKQNYRGKDFQRYDCIKIIINVLNYGRTIGLDPIESSKIWEGAANTIELWQLYWSNLKSDPKTLNRINTDIKRREIAAAKIKRKKLA